MLMVEQTSLTRRRRHRRRDGSTATRTRRRNLPVALSLSSAAAMTVRLLLFMSLFLLLLVNAKTEQADLYQLLGVTRTATTAEIKSAYRKKAKATHPDKRPDHVSAEEAAEQFRQVVEAFEILSDDQLRKHYDRTGQTSSSSGNANQQYNNRNRQSRTTFTWNFARKPIRLKDRFDVQQAQSRVLHVASLKQLFTVITDAVDDSTNNNIPKSGGILERNLLICIVTPGAVQTHVQDEMVFPYPFAGKSPQGIWWEDVLQTVQIKVYDTKKSAFAEFFHLAAAADDDDDDDTSNHNNHLDQGVPLFLFGKRGQVLEHKNLQRLSTRSRTTFEEWMWQQIRVTTIFINRHSHAVEIYWIHNNRATFQFQLDAHGGRHTFTSMLTHEFWARDARVDTRPDSPRRTKLTRESMLGSWKIVTDDDPQVFVVQPKTCFDLSGHCVFWRSTGECRKNPAFMAEQCRLSCQWCDPKQDEKLAVNIDDDKEKGNANRHGTGDEL